MDGQKDEAMEKDYFIVPLKFLWKGRKKHQIVQRSKDILYQLQSNNSRNVNANQYICTHNFILI